MKHRHIARQASLQVLTSLLLQKTNINDLIQFVHKEFAERLSNTDFIEMIVKGVLKHQEALDVKIQKFAPEWPINKLDPVERSILEMGSYELYHTDTPAAIIINECVDLAKEFGDDSAGRFINGVLSSVGDDAGKILKKK